jgi:cell division protein ZapA
MPTVTIPLNGRNYDIACGPGEEDRVQEVAARLRERSAQRFGRKSA